MATKGLLVESCRIAVTLAIWSAHQPGPFRADAIRSARNILPVLRLRRRTMRFSRVGRLPLPEIAIGVFFLRSGSPLAPRFVSETGTRPPVVASRIDT